MHRMSLFSRLIAAAALVFAVAASAAAAPARTVPLEVPTGRSTTMTVWEPEGPVRGVVMFSSGHGGWPEHYGHLLDGWQAAGFVVVAPLHVDSLKYPERERFSMQQGFIERLADMRATSAYVAQHWPDAPVAAAGHSYGTLVSLCLGGALAGMMPLRDPRVSAVVGYSSPGRIPGLVDAQAYAGVAVPALIVTGDADLVPGFVTDWHDHLYPIETAPAGDKHALVLSGGTHNLIAGETTTHQQRASEVGTAFLKAQLLHDQAAAALLQAPAGEGERWVRR